MHYPSEVYLNGSWMPAMEARVSVFDRSFLFGDGIYEVIPFYDGVPFRLRAHLNRLKYCLDQVGMRSDQEKIRELVLEAVARGPGNTTDSAVYVQVSRGVAPRTHHFPDHSVPGLFLYAYPVTLRYFEKRQVKILISPDIRWQRCDIKSVSLMANAMLNSEAIGNGFFENVLHRNGYITEGSHSTVFFVKNNQVWTCPEGPHILSGITRQVVLELCRNLDLAVREERLSLEDLGEVDEIFLTGTTTQILSVTQAYSEGNAVFSVSEPGPVTRSLQQAFIQETRKG